MPLISSPIDGSPMHEIQRYGVKIDMCQTSGGIWLDKGEFEKIIMMVRQEALEEMQAEDRAPSGADTSSAYEAHPQPKRHQDKKEERDSIFDSLMDIFDL